MMNTLVGTVLSLGLLTATPVAAVGPGATLTQDQETGSAYDAPIAFTFDGGTASELFAQLADVYPDFSVVIDLSAKNFQINGFEARITRPYTIVELVCGVAGKVGNPDGFGGSSQTGMLRARVIESELTQILFDTSNARAGAMPMLFVQVISIQELLTSGMSVEAIFGTVEAGIDLKSDDSGGKLRFHEETGILFVKGSKDINNMVVQTIEALKSSAKWLVSDEAIAAKEARIRSEALDFLGEITKETTELERTKFEKLMKEHAANMERDRQREDRKDAELRRQLDKEDEDGNEDEEDKEEKKGG